MALATHLRRPVQLFWLRLDELDPAALDAAQHGVAIELNLVQPLVTDRRLVG
jgi:hypothetical protein